MESVNRIEIADCVEHAFDSGTVSATDLVEYAADHGARTPVIQVLGRLHGDNYHEMRELWGELADVPLDA